MKPGTYLQNDNLQQYQFRDFTKVSGNSMQYLQIQSGDHLFESSVGSEEGYIFHFIQSENTGSNEGIINIGSSTGDPIFRHGTTGQAIIVLRQIWFQGSAYFQSTGSGHTFRIAYSLAQ